MTNNDDDDERKYEVVIAEDSLTQREYLKHILEKNGFVVFGGADGKEALELVKKRKPDLVISDVIMPVMNGYEFCRAIKFDAKYNNIPVILLTALSDTKDVALALECGADNFITKPYDEEYLLLRIRQILSRDRIERVKDSEWSPVTVAFDGETYKITSDRRQMFEFLLTAYQVAIMKNLEVIKAEASLKESYKNLSDLNQIISICNVTLSLDELLKLTLEKIIEIFGYEFGAVYLINDDATGAVLKCHRETIGVDPSVMALLQNLEMGLPMNRDVLQNGVPGFFNLDKQQPYEEREKIIFKQLGAKSFALIPIKVSSQVFGLFALISLTEHDFSSVEVELLESIGREVGNAVQKALLQTKVETANDEMSLYLDIMSHDINNVITGLLGFTELLVDQLEGPLKNIVQKLFGGINQTSEIISNVSTIRRLHEKRAKLGPVALDSVIQNQKLHFSDVAFVYPGTKVKVYADDLLGQVFTNLIGNSRKFAGDTVEITISVTEKGDDLIEVTVSDNGPGITDDFKPQIFDRFRKGTSKKSGKGLGLYITRKLVEGYGGRIWATDRVAGDQSKGASVHFTLRKFS